MLNCSISLANFVFSIANINTRLWTNQPASPDPPVANCRLPVRWAIPQFWIGNYLMRARLLIALALVVSGLAWTLLGFDDADSQTTSDATEQIELRINARRIEGGRTEFALQQRTDGVWGDRILPDIRRLGDGSEIDRWRSSSVVTIDAPVVVREVEVEVEVIKEVEVEVEVVREVEVYTPPTLDALPEKPADWLPFNHDSRSERRHSNRAWRYSIEPHAEESDIWQYSDSNDVEDFLAVQFNCQREGTHPEWVLRLPNVILGDSDKLTVEFFVAGSPTYSQQFYVGSDEEQDTSWTSWEDATTVLSLIHENPPSFNDKDFSVRILGEGGVVQHQLSTYHLHRLATSSRSADPLDNILYCGQYGTEEDEEEANGDF